ncbi:Transcriptional regulator of competence genes, TfoX/Sxy family [Pedococcus dokdonensis]|uniref:Transcriptional regulator of competence genes, TfoX/Sxy family n=1 Tax=Pedococcus dokdonensis TaxID=443156 RepID=A0A1H0MF14_9MICO|nr:TfoX/Sxy family protein [Pedococcus dokdonensis]SDO79052.1 Transcriptional regulator of competence genes, TfoX/Sxy family [Pedococcus dokdonensis]
MAYDEQVAQRIRDLVAGDLDVTEKKMFGGLAFLVNGNMSVAASSKGGLMVRLDADEAQRLLEQPAVRPFEMRGKPMNGWLRVDEAGFETEPQLREWVDRSVEYARTLPHK